MHSAQRVLLLVASLLCLALLKHLWKDASLRDVGRPASTTATLASSSRSAEQSALHLHAIPDKDDRPSQDCGSQEGIEDLVIILKTGSTEIYQKLPIHLSTTFVCARHYRIYSDHEQRFGRVQVHDALRLVSDANRNEHEQLRQYRSLQEHLRGDGDAAGLKGDGGWALDKWKFLPMVRDAFHEIGDRRKWYFFIEADTYLSTQNLLLWLRRLDHKEPIYAGAQVVIGDTEFAHGGSGFLLSSSAAARLTASYEQHQRSWEETVAADCCGDKVMSEALLAASPQVRLLRAFPLIQGETLESLDWSPTHWCSPAATWHHVDAAGIDKLWQFERRWRSSKGTEDPIIFADYFEAFINPRITAANGTMTAWDNLCNDWAFEVDRLLDPAIESAEACKDWCRREVECLQWAWRPGSCRGNKAVRLGWALSNRPALGSADNRIAKVESQDAEGAVSGWLLDKIEAFRAAQEPCDRSQGWSSKKHG